jgi:hypothetical protein
MLQHAKEMQTLYEGALSVLEQQQQQHEAAMQLKDDQLTNALLNQRHSQENAKLRQHSIKQHACILQLHIKLQDQKQEDAAVMEEKDLHHAQGTAQLQQQLEVIEQQQICNVAHMVMADVMHNAVQQLQQRAADQREQRHLQEKEQLQQQLAVVEQQRIHGVAHMVMADVVRNAVQQLQQRTADQWEQQHLQEKAELWQHIFKLEAFSEQLLDHLGLVVAERDAAVCSQQTAPLSSLAAGTSSSSYMASCGGRSSSRMTSDAATQTEQPAATADAAFLNVMNTLQPRRGAASSSSPQVRCLQLYQRGACMASSHICL